DTRQRISPSVLAIARSSNRGAPASPPSPAWAGTMYQSPSGPATAKVAIAATSSSSYRCHRTRPVPVSSATTLSRSAASPWKSRASTTVAPPSVSTPPTRRYASSRQNQRSSPVVGSTSRAPEVSSITSPAAVAQAWVARLSGADGRSTVHTGGPSTAGAGPDRVIASAVWEVTVPTTVWPPTTSSVTNPPATTAPAGPPRNWARRTAARFPNPRFRASASPNGNSRRNCRIASTQVRHPAAVSSPASIATSGP